MNKLYILEHLKSAIKPGAFPGKLIYQNKRAKTFWMVLGIVFTCCLLLFLMLVYLVVFKQGHEFDDSVAVLVTQLRSPGLVELMRKITFLGSSRFLLPAYLVIISYLLVKRAYREATRVAVFSFGSWVVIYALKRIIHRERPGIRLVNDITSYSFPSAHAYSSLIFFTILAILIARRQAPSWYKNLVLVLVLCFPPVVGLSRIILNVHYTTDVIAGFCLAVIWLILAYTFYIRHEPETV